MASASNTSMQPRLEEAAPSTSASASDGSSMLAFVRYKPPTAISSILSLCSDQSDLMASSSNASTNPQPEEPAPSTSASASSESSTPAFVEYKPPKTKLAFQSGKRFHVFLSFRGPDVRKTLVDHLYEALSAAGLNIFLDSEKLEKGEIIGESLESAIESSAIRIPIFSEGYADSAWCLKEAAAMLNSPGSIIPLFYYVDPANVRHPLKESSPYKKSFLRHYGHSDRYQQICPSLKSYGHEVRYRGKEIDGWKNALREICKSSGWSMDITGGFEARLVKRVVKDLIKTLDKVPLEVAKHPVGIDNVKDSLIQELKLNLVDENSVDKVRKVGIWGIGGIGKTTVAKAVYNQVYAHFNAASFVFDVRATAAETSGLAKLQKKVLRDLCRYDGEVDSVEEGKFLFSHHLRGKSVLLILDDVYTVEQLDALVGNWLAPGSRVIITSRDKHILNHNVAGVSSECVHEMSGLDINVGLQLFSWHAFLLPSPPIREDLSKGIVEACKGHPLSLEVIGSFLFDKREDEGCWKDALSNISLIPDIQQRVHDTLRISYDGLSKMEREIFVDVACFFNGEDKTLPIVFWNSLYRSVQTAVSNLQMKLLIEMDDKGVFHMHDHLRDMGRTIAENEAKRTRLWRVAHLSTLSDNINLSRLRLNEGNPQRLEMLKMMCRRGLLYLHLQNLCIEGTTEDTLAMLPRSLIWLKLEHCPFAIGTNREVKQRHSRFMENFWQLKIMQLNDCADLDSHFISSLFSPPNNLQHLDLIFCKSLISLPDSIGNLSQLQHLDLRCCESLISLPNSIGNLSQLQHLNMIGCLSLKNLPSTIGNLSRLQNLYLRKCRSLNDLPFRIGDLSQLQHLDLEECINLTYLPSSIGDMSQLQHLNLKCCESLKNLPHEIDNLSQLQIKLRGCKSLHNLPPSILSRAQLHF